MHACFIEFFSSINVLRDYGIKKRHVCSYVCLMTMCLYIYVCLFVCLLCVAVCLSLCLSVFNMSVCQ